MNILLVEDNELDVLNIKRGFQSAKISHTLVVKSSATEALDHLNHNPVPEKLVILLDINMPGMSGIDFLKILRDIPKYKRIPVFILTHSKQESERLEAIDYHVAGFIQKPSFSAEFQSTIQTIYDFWEINEFL